MSPTPKVTRSVWAVLTLVFVHLVTALPWPWEARSVPLSLVVPSPDGVLIGLCVFLLAIGKVRRVRLSGHALAGLVLLAILFRLGYTLFPTFYGKAFEPWHDVQLGALDHLLLNDKPVIVQWLARIGVIALLVALHLLLALGLTELLSFLRERRRLVRIGLVLLWAWSAHWWAKSLWHPVEPPLPSMVRVALGEGVGRVLGSGQDGATPFGELLEEAAKEREGLPNRFEGLEGADVYVVFIESYGRVAWGSVGRPRMTEWCAELGQRLEGAGFSSATGMVYPSIRGGQSSLAHAEFQSGVRVANRTAMRQLLASELPALPRLFRDSGYRTYNVHPATTEEWPEGKYFGFEHDVFQAQLPYEGTRYHWGRMPDQFALRTVLERDVRPDPRPVYLQYVSVTSHAPFSMIPPYVDDWAEAGDPARYATPAKQYTIAWTNFATHPDLADAYLESIRYSLRTMVGMTTQLQRPALVLVLGDHQPPLRSAVLGVDARYDVPLHVWTNRPRLLTPFLNQGFERGLVPNSEATAFSLSKMATRLLQWFGPPK